MTIGLLLGCGLGGAVCLLIYALVPPRPQLAQSVRRWERQRTQHAVTGASVGGGGFDLESQQQKLGRWLVAQLSRRGVTMTSCGPTSSSPRPVSKRTWFASAGTRCSGC